MIDELGLTPAPSVAMLLAEAGEQAQGAASVSYERLAAVDADLLFVGSYVPLDAVAGSAGLALLEAQPLWAGLPAVAAGRVHEFAQGVSYQSGPTATAFLDVVERALLG